MSKEFHIEMIDNIEDYTKRFTIVRGMCDIVEKKLGVFSSPGSNYVITNNDYWIVLGNLADEAIKEVFDDSYFGADDGVQRELEVPQYSITPHKTLRETIADLPEPDTEEGEKILNHYGTKHKVKINGYLGNRKLNWDKPSPTIVGRGGGTGGAVIAVHPNCERRFTVRETARIQTFPDDFQFMGSTGSHFSILFWEGCYEYKASIYYESGTWNEPSELYIDYIDFVFVETFESRMREDKLNKLFGLDSQLF